MMRSPRARWRAGIIAAGQGTRLQGAGPLKPLVTIAGRPLIDCVLGSIAEVEPSEVVVIVNEESTAVREHVVARSWPFTIRWIVETTPSSMHSFLRVLEALAAGGEDGPFLLSTVDTVAAHGSFLAFAERARRARADVVLAVHAAGHDEKPLLLRVGSDGCRVEALGAAVRRDDPGVFATAGYYCVSARVLAEAAAARADNLTALRLFLARLLERGYAIAAVPVSSGVDVDRPGDVPAAEAFLRQVHAR
jgi:NDP-sugar pyrophosphorylase family protein